MQHLPRTAQSGLLLIELIVVTAISVIIFGALFVSFQFTLELTAQSKAKLSALSLANDRMEFFRSLPYSNVGTLTGIIRGPVANNQTLRLNGIDFTERIAIDYIDGPGDGLGSSDTNGITQDYKQIKLEYTWVVNGELQDIALVSNIVPRSIESTVGGGTVRVTVIDHNSLPLPGATVVLTNASTTAPIYESRNTNATGEVLFSGAPADSNYELLVTGFIGGRQYSTAGTYVVSTANPNPVVAPFAVVESGISTLTFQIGTLSDLTIAAKSAVFENSQLEPFFDMSGVASGTATMLAMGGQLTLADTAGVYPSSGVVFLNSITPTLIEQWEVMRVVPEVPSNTTYSIRLYTGSATTSYTLVPDSDLPGNSVGFTDTLIDIGSLNSATYPSLTVGVTLLTTDATVTPRINELAVYWRESSVARSGLTLGVRGDKLIGTTLLMAPIYKLDDSIVTDGSGSTTMTALEFDAYTFTPTSALDLASACPNYPVRLTAGRNLMAELVYVPPAAHTLRVIVQDGLGRPIPSAVIQLQRSGYDVTRIASSCGQTHFTGGVTLAADYTLTVSAAGYATQSLSTFSIENDTVSTITLVP